MQQSQLVYLLDFVKDDAFIKITFFVIFVLLSSFFNWTIQMQHSKGVNAPQEQLSLST